MTSSATSACRRRWSHIGCRSVGLPDRIIEGWFIPDVPGPQWCHPDVLRLIKRRSVAMLRQQIEPVSQAALATFLPRWQNIGRHSSTRLRGPDGVLLAIRAMAGVPVPASALEESILPLRVTGYTAGMLDELTSAGEVLWTGSAPLPGGDGWIALAPADVGFLLPRATDPPSDPVATELLELLRSGGGWFVADLRSRMTSPDIDPGHLDTGAPGAPLGRIGEQRHDRAGARHAGSAPAAVDVAAPRGSGSARVDLPGGATRTCGDAHPKESSAGASGSGRGAIRERGRAGAHTRSRGDHPGAPRSLVRAARRDATP